MRLLYVPKSTRLPADGQDSRSCLWRLSDKRHKQPLLDHRHKSPDYFSC